MRTPLNLSNIDFDSLKQSLKSYMASQTAFQDYDFEGSNINVLLDLLASTGQLYLFYNHLALNESFIDSALVKSSVISKAKELGYTPSGTKSAQATVNLVLDNVTTQQSNVPVPRGTQFSGTGTDGKTYSFVTLNDINLIRNNQTNYSYNNLTIYEGRLYTNQTIVDTTTKTIRIPNINVDTRSLLVTVTSSLTNGITEEFLRSDTILNLTSNSNVYYVQMNGSSEFEIYFGDGYISRALSVGNIVTISYLVNSGTTNTNDISLFTLESSLAPNSISSVTTTAISYGAALAESLEQIRDNAKKSFATQYRSVVPYDYKVNILKDYPDITSVHVWGGEDNDPPTIGKVYCCVLKTDLVPLSNIAKLNLIKVIKSRSVINVTPIIVDADIMTLSIIGHVRCNRHLTLQSPQSLLNNILSTISSYNDTYMKKFGSNFQLSVLTSSILKLDNSFTGTSLKASISLKQLKQNVPTTYTFKFRNELDTTTIISNDIILPSYSATQVYKLCDLNGYIKAFFIDSTGTKQYTSQNFGTVDYINGIITLPNFNPTLMPGENYITMTSQAESPEILAKYNHVFNIDINKCIISILAES